MVATVLNGRLQGLRQLHQQLDAIGSTRDPPGVNYGIFRFDQHPGSFCNRTRFSGRRRGQSKLWDAQCTALLFGDGLLLKLAIRRDDHWLHRRSHRNLVGLHD
jgi:hypothetical protein